MVGGKQKVFDACKDILAAMGSTEIREDDIIPLNEPQSSRKYPADRQRII